MTTKHNLHNLIELAGKYLPPDALDRIKQAHAIIAKRYPDVLEHVTHTATVVAEFQLDEPCIIAALLHKVPQHKDAKLDELKDEFGPETIKLVKSMAKLGKVAWDNELAGKTTAKEDAGGKSLAGKTTAEEEAENKDLAGKTTAEEEAENKKLAEKPTAEEEAYAEKLRKMLVAMAEDVRVIFIKLACISDEVSKLKPEYKTKEADALATETMKIYAPLAHRLGMWQIKAGLEDAAFHYQYPNNYRKIDDAIKENRVESESRIKDTIDAIKEALSNAGIKAEITGRIKNIYSVNRKLGKYVAAGKAANRDEALDQISDLLGLRVLVDEVKDCYAALGIIHNLWHPIPDEFNDYIANPRGGIYQSIHTTVMFTADLPLEIQIRTHEMHRVAEYGIAAHWRYKEGSKLDKEFDKQMAGLRSMLERLKNIGGKEFLESMETEIIGDAVMVYTPKGEIKDLPAGSTPLDFAYRIHTGLGHRCTGAKVNGHMVPLTYQLKSGDTVEIIAGKSDKGPSRDWLNPDLGYLQSSHSREKVRQWFRKQERGDNIQRGKEILDKELLKLGISISEEELAELFNKDSVDEFLAAIGYGDISTHQIANRLSITEEKPIPETAVKKRGAASGIKVMGVDNLLTQLATCCNPMPGDDIIGYVTRSKGITVHRKDCSNVTNITDKARLISVGWGAADETYSVPIRIEAFKRVGLLHDISGIVADEGINIAASNTADRTDGTSVITLTLQTKGLGQLSRLFSRLEGVHGIINAVRVK
jgi:GTP diphosphokinase / guanosine-3',5'-bis(diphosphate) 3'-diphosphatase